MENMDYSLISELVLQKTHPVYVINEATREIVFTNKKLDEMMGCSLVGENCLEAFFGDMSMETVIPASREPGESYQWDYADKNAGKLFKILDLWYESEGQRYRVGVITDTSDLMDLNRSMADYLWLMQELTELQMKLTKQREDIFPSLLTFLGSHYEAKRVIISFFEDSRPVSYIAEKGEVQRLDTFFDSGQPQHVFKAGSRSFSLWLESIKNAQAWDEDRGFVLSVAGLYIENSILWQKLQWENTHDRLTGLLNRSALDSLIKERYANADSLGIIYLDIDDSKRTNDYFGREAGDNLLKRMAEVLKAVSNEQAHAFRVSGDEFMLVCENYTEERLGALESAIQTMVTDTNLAEAAPRLSVSCGRAVGKSPFTVEALMRTADKHAHSGKSRL